ncbi:hypothetical protein AVEN_165237-1 [Araneus ventricosus]|uniref:Uncharacterized protein n=1 Tax=Araneus ventricosus TaxID=182803 RepID=A0A4Y2B8B0_ARAVE|nr:hypothetical protein AVEN_165237-1 [Araneus ventricosus]
MGYQTLLHTRLQWCLLERQYLSFGQPVIRLGEVIAYAHTIPSLPYSNGELYMQLNLDILIKTSEKETIFALGIMSSVYGEQSTEFGDNDGYSMPTRRDRYRI